VGGVGGGFLFFFVWFVCFVWSLVFFGVFGVLCCCLVLWFFGFCFCLFFFCVLEGYEGGGFLLFVFVFFLCWFCIV